MDIPQTLVLLGRYAQNGAAAPAPSWPLALGISSCGTVEDKSTSQKHPAGISTGWRWSLCPQLQQSPQNSRLQHLRTVVREGLTHTGAEHPRPSPK